MKSGNVLLGVLAGVAAGSLVGILFAPEKGSKTRQNILSKGEEYAGVLKENFDGLVDEVSKKVENTWHDVEDLTSKGKTKYDETKKEVKNLIS